jgi:hypothetical protein
MDTDKSHDHPHTIRRTFGRIFRLTFRALELPAHPWYWVLHVLHSSRAVHGPVRGRILLNSAELAAEPDHMTDAHTGLISTEAAELRR